MLYAKTYIRTIIRINRLIIALFFMITATAVKAQDANDHHETPLAGDSLCLKNCFPGARWEAHTRTFAMSTLNEGALKDDYAIASGAGIGVLTKPIYGFQAGVSGFFIYNLASSALSHPDPLTKSANRYETGLFDMQDLNNRKDLDRLEELYLKYNRGKSSVTAGKMKLNTPFINSQDSRMRPTVVQGIWLSIAESEKTGLNGGWISGISPRSTVKWFSLDNSMGIYPSGQSTSGQPSDYFGNIEGSSGMAIVNMYHHVRKNTRINLWNAYLENMMNTAMLEINMNQYARGAEFYQGLILLHQDAVNNGGNADPQKTYIDRGAVSNVISAQAGAKTGKFNTSINYTHITGDGRYLMPREFGKELFYTVMQRERVEGFGNVHAFLLKTTYSPGTRFATTLGYGYSHLPDVMDYRLNKYGLPSYHQVNYSVSYVFGHFLQGMNLRFLAAYKIRQGDTHNDPRYVYNKVNMLNLNLILDFKI
jgi:hypothetical protein